MEGETHVSVSGSRRRRLSESLRDAMRFLLSFSELRVNKGVRTSHSHGMALEHVGGNPHVGDPQFSKAPGGNEVMPLALKSIDPAKSGQTPERLTGAPGNKQNQT